MSRSVISTRFLADFSQQVRELGGEPDQVATSAGVSPGIFTGPEIDIDYGQYAALLSRAADATGCRHFGLLLGARHDLSLLGAIGIIILLPTPHHCVTLTDLAPSVPTPQAQRARIQAQALWR